MSKNRWQIAFAPEGDGLYEVTVRRTGSVYRFTTRLPPDISDLWEVVDQSESAPNRSFRRAPGELTPEARFFQAANLPTLKEIGSRLLASVINLDGGNDGTETVGALKERMNSNDGVDIEFDLSQTAELSAIPWESLYLGGEKDQFLAIFSRTNIVRRLDAQSELPPPIERPIRILVAAANPKADLDTHVELGNIQRRIDELVKSGSSDFEVQSLPAATRDQFRRKVMEWKPHVIHYIGHSAFHDDSGYLYFETDDEGVSDQVSAETLRNMLLNRRPWLVILNSCQSGQTSRELPMAGVAQNLLQRLNIPFVVAMQQPVSDDAAINFSQDFYSALTDGETIASAVTMGRCAIANNIDERTQVELITPALYTSGDTDKIEFVDDRAAVAATGTAVAPESADNRNSGGIFVSARNAKIAGLVALAGMAGLGAFLAWPEAEPGPSPPADERTTTEPPAGADTRDSPSLRPTDPVGTADDPTGPSTAPVSQGPTGANSSSGAENLVAASARQTTGPRTLRRSSGNNQPASTGSEDWVEVISASREIDADTGEVYYLLELENGIATSSDRAYAPGDLFYIPRDGENVSGGGVRPMPRYLPPTASTAAYAVATGQVFQQVSASIPPSNGSASSDWPAAYRSETLEAAELPPRANDDGLETFRPAGFCDGLLTTVYFDLGSSELNGNYRQWLEQQANSLDCPESQLVLAGFTDASGPLDFNIDLSLERARAVAEEFRKKPEVRSKETALLAYAEQRQVFATPDGAVEPINRRAEIYIDFDCASLDDAEVTLASDENFNKEAPPTPYQLEDDVLKPLRIVYQARGFNSEDPEVRDRAHMLADARLEELSRQVSTAWNVPPGMISSIKISGKCLAPGDDERVDIDF